MFSRFLTPTPSHSWHFFTTIRRQTWQIWSTLHVVKLLDFLYIINTYVFGTLTVPLCNKVNRVFMVCRETSGRTRNGSSISSKISFRNGVVVLSIEQCELIFPLKHCMVKSEWRWLHWILEIYRFFLVF